MEQIVNDLMNEVIRQEKLWGKAFDDKNTKNDWVAYICRYVAEGAYGKQHTPERFREHLEKAAAICISAMLAIDRNGDCTKTHYDNN